MTQQNRQQSGEGEGEGEGGQTYWNTRTCGGLSLLQIMDLGRLAISAKSSAWPERLKLRESAWETSVSRRRMMYLEYIVRSLQSAAKVPPVCVGALSGSLFSSWSP